MKKFFRGSLAIVVLFTVSITLTGCDMSRIGSFIQTVSGIIQKVSETIKSFGNSGGSGGSGTTVAPPVENPPTTEAPPTTVTPPTDTGTSTGNSTDPSNCAIVIYSTSWCTYCKDAKAYFQSRGTPFTEKDIEKDPAAKQEMETKARAQGINPSGVPVIDICGTLVVGFDKAQVERILAEKAGKGASTESDSPGK